MNIDLENDIYLLRQSNLPKDLREKITEADKLYLKDKEKEAKRLIQTIKKEAETRGIPLEGVSPI